MSCQKIVLIAIATVVTAALVTSRPANRQHEPASRALSEVVNKTMCPIKVHIDDNPERVPRRIKFLKCDENPNRLCVEHQMTHGCCQHHHHNYLTECVEIYDWIQVTYKGSESPDTMKVPVGCTCMIEETTMPGEIP